MPRTRKVLLLASLLVATLAVCVVLMARSGSESAPGGSRSESASSAADPDGPTTRVGNKTVKGESGGPLPPALQHIETPRPSR